MNRFILAKPAWLSPFRPAVKNVQKCRFTCKRRYLAQQINRFHTSIYRTSYEETYRKSIATPELFWDEVAKGIDWFKPYDQVLDDAESPFGKW
jgi:hypothetical protein